MDNELYLPELDSTQRDDVFKIMEQARQAYEDRKRFFTNRHRSRRYYLGNQWGDKMEHPDTGEVMTEDEYIRSQGRVPAQNNQIGTVVRNLIGQFRQNYPDPVAFGINRDKAQAGEIMTAALQRAIDINEAPELDARNFEEFIVSAAAAWKTTYKWWQNLNLNDVYVEKVDQTRFFFNMDTSDIRAHDVTLVGELHDMSMDEVLAAFARNKADADRIREMFPSYDELDTTHYPEWLRRYKDFYIPDDNDKVRVIEVWRQEHRWQSFVHDEREGKYTVASDDYFLDLGFEPEEVELYSYAELVELHNAERLTRAAAQGVDPEVVPMLELEEKFEGVWRVYFITPLRELLYSSDTPYEHGGHPYSFGQYPLFDEKTRSVVEMIIDQQRHINRLISLMDHALGTSTKNIMMVPKQLVPEGMTPQEFANQSVELNGMIFYTHNPQVPLPTPIKNNTQVAGAQELLVLQMNLLKEISAVNEAVQGLEPKSGTPAALYAQQAANATISNKDIFDFYYGLMRKRNRKIIMTIKQFYEEKRYIKIAGTGFSQKTEKVYDPDEVKDVDFDVVMGETQNTLSYRQIVDNYLKEFLDAQYITFEEYLQNTSLPFADKLLQTISNRNQGPMGGDGQPAGQPGIGGLDPDMVNQIARGEITPEIAQEFNLPQRQN
nr:hypothetical protein 21 [Balneolaceae bacterium]